MTPNAISIAVFTVVASALLAWHRPVVAIDAPTATSGRALFEEKCAMCHRAGGMGTGLLARRYPKGQELLEQRGDLNAVFITVVARRGLGNMPPLSRAEISDSQLASVSAYLAGSAP